MEPEKTSGLPDFKSPINTKRLFLLIGGAVVALAVLGGGGYYLYSAGRSKAPVAVITPTPTAIATDITPTPTPQPCTTNTGTANTTAGVTWLDTPQKLGNLCLFTNLYAGDKSNPADISGITYYRAGTDNSHDLITAVMPPDGPGGSLFGLFRKDSDTSYSLLKNYSPNFYNVDDGKLGVPDFLSKVKVDTTTTYPALAYQKTLTVKNQTITNYSRTYDFYPDLVLNTTYDNGDATQSLALYATTSWGNVYTRKLGKGDGFEVQEFILKLPDQSALSYQSQPDFVGDDAIPKITWNNGAANKDTYRADGIGNCGSANGVAVMNSTSLTGLTKTGTNKNGEAIYEFSDANNATLKYFYNLYALDGQGKPMPDVVSLATYRAKHGVFLWQDKIGRLIVFNSTVYGAAVECGKPVVYLYPTKPTNVTVKVDAKITKSDPTYPTDGWKVLAMPNGTLFSGGKQYDSLFWEGTGHEYPTVIQGTIIAQSDIASALRTQLVQLGLNQKEADDFLAFWLPKMPKTPYVRVTWFGKSQMDRLAPLTITPKPDTVIRIFMDFEGLGRPISIQPQRLAAPVRKGFTAVEWGGLLRSQSP